MIISSVSMVMAAQGKMNDVLHGFILKQIDYKDASVILTFLSEEYGKISLVASSVRKASSKNAGRVIPYMKAQCLIDYQDGRTMYTLKNVSTIKTYKNMHMDLERSTASAIIAEIADKFVMNGEESEYYKDVYACIDQCYACLEYGGNVLTILTLFCSDIMKYFGIAADVDECVHCGSRLVSALSIKEGGFLCKSCASLLNVPCTDLSDLKRFRLLSKASIKNYDVIIKSCHVSYRDLKTFIEMITVHTGIKITSFGLFERLFAIE